MDIMTLLSVFDRGLDYPDKDNKTLTPSQDIDRAGLDKVNIQVIGISLGGLLKNIKPHVFSENQHEAVRLIQLIPPKLKISSPNGTSEDAEYSVRELILLRLQECASNSNWLCLKGIDVDKAPNFLKTFYRSISDIDKSFIRHIEKVSIAFKA